ncbi:MAG: FAD-dependent oxidoreductase [Clostridia bacterium]|nr:FAD-dependent oxidoreductase [Clostridia bacterium]
MKYCKEISERGKYDVVVCGGGFAGFGAACAAAREGADVLLIERDCCLGGTGTKGMVNHLLGARRFIGDSLYTCVGGLFSEIEQALLSSGGAVDVHTVDPALTPHGWAPILGAGLIFDPEKMKLTLENIAEKYGVRILYTTDVVDVETDGRTLSGVIVHNKDGLSVVRGKYFVDATGDADLCRMAGCSVVKGDESGGMAAASLEMHVENVNAAELTEYMRVTGDIRFINLIKPLKESGEWDFPYGIFISVQMTRPDVFMINTIRQVGVDGTSADSVTKAIIDGRKENFRLLEIMRAHFPGFSEAKIRQVAPTMGIRETYRLVGEYVLTVDDLVTARDFADGIALSAYHWDMPDPKSPSRQPLNGVKTASPYTQIPYRCLIPREKDNLIVAGRCISAEREVLGPVRVMAPCLAVGEAAGIAAAQVSSNGKRFLDADITKLRQTITARGGYVDRGSVRSEKIK